ncbi:MAG: hypothetical protein R2709_13465 [Marmoricola sp.]
MAARSCRLQMWRLLPQSARLATTLVKGNGGELLGVETIDRYYESVLTCVGDGPRALKIVYTPAWRRWRSHRGVVAAG